MHKFSLICVVIVTGCSSGYRRDYEYLGQSNGVKVNDLDVRIIDNPNFFSDEVKFEVKINGEIQSLSIKADLDPEIHVANWPRKIDYKDGSEIVIKLTPLNYSYPINSDGKISNFSTTIEISETVPHWGQTKYFFECGNLVKSLSVYRGK